MEPDIQAHGPCLPWATRFLGRLLGPPLGISLFACASHGWPGPDHTGVFPQRVRRSHAVIFLRPLSHPLLLGPLVLRSGLIPNFPQTLLMHLLVYTVSPDLWFLNVKKFFLKNTYLFVCVFMLPVCAYVSCRCRGHRTACLGWFFFTV